MGGGGVLYIGCNQRGRLGHWLTAADHIHVIILQNATHNKSEAFLPLSSGKSGQFILELSCLTLLQLF